MNLSWEYWLGTIVYWLGILGVGFSVAWGIHYFYKEWRFSKILEFYIHKITDLEGIKSRYIPYLWGEKKIKSSVRLATMPDSNFIMLRGVGGSGKTHTMIDYVEGISKKYRWYNRKAKVFIPKCPKSFTGISVEKIPKKINRDVVLLWDDLHIGFEKVHSHFEDAIGVLESACLPKKFIMIVTTRSEDFEKLEKEGFLTHTLYNRFETQELKNLDEKTVFKLTNICLKSYHLRLTRELHIELITKIMSAQPIPGYIVSASKRLKDISRERELTVNDIHELEDDIRGLWLHYYREYDKDRRRLIETIKIFRMYMFYVKLEYVERVCTQYFKVEKNSYKEAFNALNGIWFDLRDDMLETWEAQYEGIPIERNEKLLLGIFRIIINKPLIDDFWVSSSSSNLGVALSALNKNEEAMECYDEVIKINPNFAEAWNNKGLSLSNLGRHKEVIECLDIALKINPNFAEAWNNKGLSLSNLGRHKEAIECLDIALKINSNLAEVWHNKGNALFDLGRLKEAIECYNKSLKINPHNAKLWYSKGLSLLKLGRYKEAIECYNKSLKINSNLAEVWCYKGAALLFLSEYEEAIECLDKALKSNPNFVEAWHFKGTVFLSVGREKEAQRCFENVNELDEEFYRNHIGNKK